MTDYPTINIDKLATLARIHLSSEEKAELADQIPQIVAFFDQLQKADVSGVSPMAHPFEVEPQLRKDVEEKPWSSARALSNAPAAKDSQIVVPKVVEDA
jgi:aspartyl-tRNA(Asn)/glutamyl-tRNA(Gln) amidotransferase subunit C